MDKDKLAPLTKDLTLEPPRSPRETLAGYVILARTVDKCRAALLGKNGEYNYSPCSLTSEWSPFTGIDPDDLKDYVATGATDDEIADWVTERTNKEPIDIIKWNNQMRERKLSELPDGAQAYIENYREENLPVHPPIRVWFDMFDIEEGRV